MKRTIQSKIWLGATGLFLCLGVFFHAWHPGWLVFLLAMAVSEGTNLFLLYREELEL